MFEIKISKYINYLGDTEYMADVVTSPGAVNSLIKLLQSNEREIISDTCFFIRDFVLSCSKNHICRQSWESQLKSAIIPELENLLFADNHFIRKDAVYTLGKICSYDSIPVMLNAFYKLRDRDPILLPRLIGELFWLGINNPWDVINSMAVSDRYITRWAVVDVLGKFSCNSPNDEDFLRAHRLCDLLRRDAHSLVREEAEYNYQFLELQRRKHQENISKAEYRQQSKELKKISIFLHFNNIGNQFCNYMYARNLHTYTSEELENFINNLKNSL
ncbi:HEAT repeat domain-containing protein [Kamptonema animale CS-326]|jgi:hypothetical protein|uniref:HEAT repeat domain-containing protein n=1 Tax=Kamptonema animale TaxID=92934 RepID=UPI002330E4EF|nr:HEAT repeat domain-containing protein [Kamptonema animale]MDB9513953.1 HEAT repeat domain-containing protein [Kamptonema animale CS-326]